MKRSTLTGTRQLLVLIMMVLTFVSCQDETEGLTANDDLQLPEVPSVAAITASGTVLYSKWGTNLNNRYTDGAAKTDWERFNTFHSNINTALNSLEKKVFGFKIYRVGFSREMASSATELDQWAEGIRGISDHGNKVIICMWGSHDYSNSSGDANVWQTVVNKINSEGLMNAVKGWELNNEPTKGGGNDLGTYYTQVVNGVSNWHGKKIILDGPNYARKINNKLVNNTSSISNRQFAVHIYPRWIDGGNPDPSLSTAQWRDRFIRKFNEWYGPANNNFIVTELGISNDYVNNPTDAQGKRTRGFIAACEAYFNNNTTVFWYTSYNQAPVGLLSINNNRVRENNKTALERVF